MSVVALGVCGLSLGSGCESTSGQGDTAEALYSGAVPGEAWLETSLYFGLARLDEGGAPLDELTLAQWQGFLDTQVSPRFPDGLTVYDAYGQWMRRDSRDGQPNRLISRVLVILHPDTPEDNAKIEAIRQAFLDQYGHESVLRTSLPARVSF
ncbi:MAG: DUF3574 domain-containing protein [Opitutales bacterium]